jgi:hypothetical protein
MTEEDWPRYIKERSACFRTDRETVIETEIGKDLFDQILDEEMVRFNIREKDHALKNPRVVSAVLKSASTSGKTSPSLDLIVKHVLAMKD